MSPTGDRLFRDEGYGLSWHKQMFETPSYLFVGFWLRYKCLVLCVTNTSLKHKHSSCEVGSWVSYYVDMLGVEV